MSARALPVALLALLLLAAACQPAAESSPTATATATATAADTPSPASATVESETIDVDNIEVDDCYNAPETNVDTVELVDCAQLHVFQAFALIDYPASADDPFPGAQALNDYGSQECRDRFDAYVGLAYEDSIYFIGRLNPSEFTWAAGDREIICNLQLEDRSEWTGSAKGSEE